MSKFETNYAVVPGEYLREYMEDNRVSVEDIAAASGLTTDSVEAILAGTGAIGELEAHYLHRATNIPSEWWLRLQSTALEDLIRLAAKAQS